MGGKRVLYIWEKKDRVRSFITEKRPQFKRVNPTYIHEERGTCQREKTGLGRHASSREKWEEG